MEHGILTNLLNHIVSVLTLGYARLLPDAFYLTRCFIIIEIVLLGLWWAFNKQDIAISAIKKITTIFFYIWVIENFKMLTNTLICSFSRIGFIAGGETLTHSIIFDPSYISDLGFRAIRPIFDNTTSFISQLTSPLDNILMGLCALIVLLSYFMIAIQMFLVVVEFYMFTVISIVLIPFAIFKPTAFIGEKAIGATFSIGVKVMVLCLVISLSLSFLQNLSLPSDPTVEDIFILILGSLSVTFLSWHAPSLAAGYLSGSPNLTAGAAGGFMAGGVAAGKGAMAAQGMASRSTIDAVKRGSSAMITAANYTASKLPKRPG